MEFVRLLIVVKVTAEHGGLLRVFHALTKVVVGIEIGRTPKNTLEEGPSSPWLDVYLLNTHLSVWQRIIGPGPLWCQCSVVQEQLLQTSITHVLFILATEASHKVWGKVLKWSVGFAHPCNLTYKPYLLGRYHST